MGRYDVIKQIINIRDYWKVIVYYNIDYNFFNVISKDFGNEVEAKKIYYNMITNRAKAFTYNDTKNKLSVVGFNKHTNIYDYIDSIVHEAEHVKEGILDYYKVPNYGESPAYTIGYIVSEMYKVFNRYILL